MAKYSFKCRIRGEKEKVKDKTIKLFQMIQFDLLVIIVELAILIGMLVKN